MAISRPSGLGELHEKWFLMQEVDKKREGE